MRQKRKENIDDVMPSDVCYCYGLPFMVCYVFLCQDCANDKHESWTAKQTNFSHMCIMALANMVVNHFKEQSPEVDAVDLPDVVMKAEPKFFRLDTEIIPFFDENWESLTPLARRVKTTWHGTIAKTLAKETELFVGNDEDENLYTLKERDLTTIGPFHKAVRNLGKRAPSSAPTAVLDPTDEDSGPKTRGASKRKQVENVLTSVPKRYRTTGNTEPSPLNEGVNQNVDAPFNRGEIRYYLAEEDPCVTDKNQNAGAADDGAVRMLIPHHYRIVNPPVVMISPNDRAHQLKLDADGLTVTGNGGYAMARATHSVSYGRWFYEIEFLNQPGDSHIRVGWARSHSVAQACVGYSKFSYGWRSLKGTAFHDGCGLTYSLPGFKQGDVLGCLIDLPDWEEQIENDRQIGTMLPKSHKKNQVIKFKNNFFFEEHDDVSGAVTRLKEVPGSKIEFFLNGRSQGAAFNEIYEGFYFPAVSIFHDATVRCNFGPKFRYPLPKKSMPMSARPEQVIAEQTLIDICDLVSMNEDQQKLNPLLTAKEEPMEH